MAGGHDGRTAVAQVTGQESSLSPYRRSLFEARSSHNAHYQLVTSTRLRNVSLARGRREAVKSRILCCCLIALAGSAGCSASNSPSPGAAAPVAHVASGKGGRILSMRPVTLRTGQDTWRAVLLADTGAANAAEPGNTALTEFIVRSDDGATLSIVQANTPGFRPGDRVTILQGENTRLAPPS
jgi:hypothetical protein